MAIEIPDWLRAGIAAEVLDLDNPAARQTTAPPARTEQVSPDSANPPETLFTRVKAINPLYLAGGAVGLGLLIFLIARKA